MIKQKFEEPKEQLQKIKNQNAKLDRIKKAYLNGAFDVKEFKEEKQIVEKAIIELENKLNETDCIEELRFTPKDILLKRDIDFINKLKLNKEYQERTKTWKHYTRQEQAELIMKYVDDIELALIGKAIAVKQINFRDSICKPCQELYDKGYIDTTKPAIKEVQYMGLLKRASYANFGYEDPSYLHNSNRYLQNLRSVTTQMRDYRESFIDGIDR